MSATKALLDPERSTHSGIGTAPIGTVALLVPSLAIGGAERQALALAEGLDSTRWRVLVVAQDRKRPADANARVAHACAGPERGIPQLVRLARILRRERVDIVQAYLLGTQVYALAAKALFPRLRLIVAVRSSLATREVVGWNGKLSHRLVFGLSSLVDHYVFNSTCGQRRVGCTLPGPKSRVVFNGIDTARFRPDPAAAASLRQLLQAPDDAPLVGIVANVNPYKGYETFVRAAALLAPRAPKARFAAIGSCEGALGVGMQALVGQLGLGSRFRFLGPRSDPEALVPGLDVVCSSSTTEGFSNAIAEAMACGVPCVVTDVGDSALIVGDTGVVVPPGDAAGLAAGIGSLLESGSKGLRRRGRAARQRVELEFGLPRMVEQYDELYVSMLGARPGAER